MRSIGKSFPERYRNALGTVIIKQGLNITLRWDNTGEIRENTISSKSGPRFTIECTRVDNSPVLSSVSTGDLSEVSEHYDDEMEDFIMLSSNKNPIVDLDEDDESLVKSFSSTSITDGYSDMLPFTNKALDKSEDHVLKRVLMGVNSIQLDKQSALFVYLSTCKDRPRTLVIVSLENVIAISHDCKSSGFSCLSIQFYLTSDVVEKLKNGQSNLLVTTADVAQIIMDHDISFPNIIIFDLPTNISIYRKISSSSQRNLLTLFHDGDGAFYELFRSNFHTDTSSMKLPPWPFHNIGSSDTLMISEHLARD